jgi:nucleolar protein 56
VKATIVECPFGDLAFDEEKKLVAKKLLSKKTQAAAAALAKVEAGNITDEIIELIKDLRQKNYDVFAFEKAELAREAQQRLNVHSEVDRPSEAGLMVRSRMDDFAVKTGFVKNADEFNLWMHNLAVEIAKLRVKGAIEKRDMVAAQAVQALDDLDRTINLLMSRTREWYGVHFPELDRLVDKHETYARLIINLGSRENFTLEKLGEEDIPAAKAEGIAKTAERSMGANLDEDDLRQIQLLCSDVLKLYELRQSMEKYMDKTMEQVAPNTMALVGSLLGARLIAVSGGLTNLARRPASTIQVLGAEKALFRSLKTGTRPPKHGMIFQHTLLHDAKRWQRGKIARALAGKLAIAARADAFGHRDISNRLKADLDRRIEEIGQKYAEPPVTVPAEPRRQKPKREEPGKRAGRKHRRER